MDSNKKVEEHFKEKKKKRNEYDQVPAALMDI